LKNKQAILFLINSIELGGAETFLLRLIKELREQFSISAYLYELKPSEKNSEFRKYFIKQTGVILLPPFNQQKNLTDKILWKLNAVTFRLFKWPFYTKYLDKKKDWHFQSLVIKNKIQLINSHLLSADLFVANFLKPITSLPWVATSQGCYNDIQDEEVAKQIAQNIDGLTYVADKNLNLFKQFSIPVHTNSQLIYNSIKAPEGEKTKSKNDLGLSDSDVLVIHVSRSIPEKGMELSILATMNAIEEGCENLHLALAGPENEHYKFLQKQYAENKNIHFLGEQMNPIEWVRIADIGILPTYFQGESCPSTIVEYMACGIPIVSTNIGEITNMISFNNELGGVLLDLTSNGQPSVSEIKDTLKLLFNDSTLKTELGVRGLKAFEKFDIKNAAYSYMKVYQRAIENN
jgi:glycosyltransferase involved in cell wall biosynthesis